MKSEIDQGPKNMRPDPDLPTGGNGSMWKYFLHLEEANPLVFYGCLSVLAATFLMVCAGVGMVIGHTRKPDPGPNVAVETLTDEDPTMDGNLPASPTDIPEPEGTETEIGTEELPSDPGMILGEDRETDQEKTTKEQPNEPSEGQKETEEESESEEETKSSEILTSGPSKPEKEETTPAVTEAPTDAPAGPASGQTTVTAVPTATIQKPTSVPAKPTPVPTAAPTPVPTAAPVPTPQPTKAPVVPGPVASAIPTPVPGVSAVAIHGRLSVSGNHLVDQNGNLYQLRGVSTHGLAWFPGFVNEASFRTLRDEWGVNAVRMALYTAEYGGYCTGGDRQALKNLIDSGVSYANKLGMYVIIDWHVLSEADPNVYRAESVEFFREMSAKYAGNPSVIYEICNEPNGGTSWASIKNYATEVISVIRANDPGAIIIVGTPNWSQFVDQAAADPISGTNLMYALHFYAGTHGSQLRNTMTSAMDSGLPVICTEFGISDASGNGAVNTAGGDEWLNTMDRYGISYFIWSLCNKAESSALINSGVNKTSGWTYNELTDSGKWYVTRLGNAANLGKITPVPTAVPTKVPEPTKAPEPTKVPEPTKTPEPTTAPEPTKVPLKPVDPTNSRLVVTEENSWQDGSDTATIYRFDLENTTDQDLSGWSVELIFDGPVTVDQSWKGTFEVKGNKIIISPENDWTKEIPAHGKADFGLIVKNSTLKNYRILK